MVPMGKIFLLTNEQEVNSAVMGGAVVLALSEVIDERIYPSGNIMPASMLLPPYEAISCLIDGYMNEFERIYRQYLSLKEQDMFLTAIVAGLFLKPNQLGIYMGPGEDNELQFKIFDVFFKHIRDSFGIFIQYPGSPFMYDMSKDQVNLSRFYILNMIDIGFLMMNYPANQMFPDFIIPKLIEEIDPCIIQPTQDKVQYYFQQLKLGCQKSHRVLIDPMNAYVPGYYA